MDVKTEIPENVIEFAKVVFEAAKTHKIDSFTVRVNAVCDDKNRRNRISGEMDILGSLSDGRGRPCENLKILYKAILGCGIVTNQESSN